MGIIRILLLINIELTGDKLNSQLTMLKSVQVNIKDITSLLTKEQDKKLQKKLLDLNETLLNDVITVLTPFDTATKHLSTDKEFSRQ